MSLLRALAEFVKRLGEGDPVAVGILIGMLVLFAVAGLIVYAVHRSLKAEDEARAKRYGRKK